MAETTFACADPATGKGRIPTVAVAGDRGTGTTARVLDQLLRECGMYTSLSLRSSVYVNGEASDQRGIKERLAPTSRPCLPEIGILSRTISLRRIGQRGLCNQCFSVSIILDRNKEGNASDFYMGISVLDRATTDALVVGCGNQLALDHLTNLERRRLIVVGNRITDPLVQEHIRQGGTIIADGWSDDGDCIVLNTGDQEIARFSLNGSWRRFSKGKAHRLRQAAKYAIAAAFGLGISMPDTSSALLSAHGT